MSYPIGVIPSRIPSVLVLVLALVLAPLISAVHVTVAHLPDAAQISASPTSPVHSFARVSHAHSSVHHDHDAHHGYHHTAAHGPLTPSVSASHAFGTLHGGHDHKDSQVEFCQLFHLHASSSALVGPIQLAVFGQKTAERFDRHLNHSVAQASALTAVARGPPVIS